jgi:hypothetical protein
MIFRLRHDSLASISLPPGLPTVERAATARLLRTMKDCKRRLMRSGQHLLAQKVTRLEP